MKELGHSLSWPTPCFINGGCGRRVWAHTNGHGDFVLFDQLAYPWPVHDCYSERIPEAAGPNPRIGASREIEAVHITAPTWTTVSEVDAASAGGQKRFDIVGDVVDLRPGMAEFLRAYPHASTARSEITRTLDGRSTFARIVSGDGRGFWAFLDSKATPVRILDTVAVRLRVRHLLNVPVFMVTKICVFSTV